MEKSYGNIICIKITQDVSIILVISETINKYSQKKLLPGNYLLKNNYSPSSFLLENKYSLQEISTPLEIVWRIVFSHLNTPGSRSATQRCPFK